MNIVGRERKEGEIGGGAGPRLQHYYVARFIAVAIAKVTPGGGHKSWPLRRRGEGGRGKSMSGLMGNNHSIFVHTWLGRERGEEKGEGR